MYEGFIFFVLYLNLFFFFGGKSFTESIRYIWLDNLKLSYFVFREINSIEKQLYESSDFSLHFTEKKLRLLCPEDSTKATHYCHPRAPLTTQDSIMRFILMLLSCKFFSTKPYGRRGVFIMNIDEKDCEDDSGEEDHSGQMVVGTRFKCDEFYASDAEDFEDDSASKIHNQLMEKAGLLEGALSELIREHQTRVTEEIRNYISAYENELVNEKKKLNSALAQVKKNVDMRREMDRKLDVQYQRRIAEALDNHLTAIQRDHEHKSKIEETKIKDDAAIEEAKRREKACLDEKLRQEKMRAYTEARLEAERKMAEKAKAVALEAEKRAAKEAADKVASEMAATPANKATDLSNKSVSETNQQAGDFVKGTENALRIETRRQQIYKEIVDKNAALGIVVTSATYQATHGSKIQKIVKPTLGTKKKVRDSAKQLTTIFLDPSCLQSASITTFAETIVTLCTNGTFDVFPKAHIIVVVSSQIPLVMDVILAKLNNVSIYTVPKYICDVKTVYDSSKTYHKIIGYVEEDGEIESEASYISRMKSYMKLYGALVQTEIQNVRNTHGIEEGWAWLARFLNSLPANRYTAVALDAFLELEFLKSRGQEIDGRVAGYSLHRKYRNQFKKLLNVVRHDFIKALKARRDHNEPSDVITSIETYIERNKFLVEPERRALPDDWKQPNYIDPDSTN